MKSIATTNELSDLARIELKSDNPIDLFTEWHNEARTNHQGFNNVVSLATVESNLNPRVRNVLLRCYDENGFIFITDRRGRKADELSANNRAAMCIYWAYKNDADEQICRQARIEGTVKELPRDEVKKFYDNDPLYCKIRAHLCHQDAESDWNELKKQHDELFNQAKNDDKFLQLPDHYVGYKLIPNWYDFYFSKDHFIADRMLFEKKKNIWIKKRLAA